MTDSQSDMPQQQTSIPKPDASSAAPAQPEPDQGGFQNLNISAYRVLFLLQLLCQHQALNINDFNQYLYQNPHIGKTYNPETLAKYINTLREAGCRIPRATATLQYSYRLAAHPFPLILPPQEALVLRKLYAHSWEHQQAQTLNPLQPVMDKLSWLFGFENTHAWLLTNGGLCTPSSSPTDADDGTAPYTVLERYCRDQQVLTIRYRPAANQPLEELHIVPTRVVFQHGKPYLLGNHNHNGQPVKLKVSGIHQLTQLPTKGRQTDRKLSVTIRLSGNLARSYRLYPEETILQRDSSGLKIRTLTDQPDVLIRRLLKYGAACEVLGPDCIRDAMKETIAAMVKAIQAPPASTGGFRAVSAPNPDGAAQYSTNRRLPP
ncbi:MAG: WYL domain-containing protein [Candidatus Melainabacteria bacterium]